MIAIALGRAIPATTIGRTAPTTVPNTASRMSRAIGQADELGPEQVPLDRLVELVLHERDAGHDRLDARRRVDRLGEMLGIVDRLLHLLGSRTTAKVRVPSVLTNDVSPTSA